MSFEKRETMIEKHRQQIEQVRERMIERAVNGSPVWMTPQLPSVRDTAGALFIGLLLKKLPTEDVPSMCNALLAAQDDDGSWENNISVTLEVVQALSESRRTDCRIALDRAVHWLEKNRARVGTIEPESLILLGALTGVSGAKSRFGDLVLKTLRSVAARRSRQPAGMKTALKILARDSHDVVAEVSVILQHQRLDGSWDGTARSTIFALAALRHASLPLNDSAFERGYRFLRALQLWNGDQLLQNTCDFSTLLHGTAARSLLSAGADAEILGPSILSLLHQHRQNGGWSIGSQSLTDVFMTSLVTDSLNFVGDMPLETLWSRRRSAMLIADSQNSDGGWPLKFRVRRNILLHRGVYGEFSSLADVSAMALLALAYSGDSSVKAEKSVRRGVNYLVASQSRSGMWPKGRLKSDMYSTVKAIEALCAAAPERARGSILKSMRAIRESQNADGGWGGSNGISDALETAWAVRALDTIPGLFRQSVRRGQQFLMIALDPEKLEWRAAPLWPVMSARVEITDLTTLHILEAFAAAPQRNFPREKPSRRSIFDKKL